jgi:peptidyl-prolyl cis-trans isomerase D
MLEAIRDRAQGWIARVILGLVILTFAAFGVDSYVNDRSTTIDVAEVGGHSISQNDFLLALRNQKDAREANGDTKVNTEDPKFRQAVLDELITTRVMALSAQKSGIAASPQRALQALADIPVFQEGGKFSNARMESWLRNRGMTQTQLLALLQDDMQIGQLEVGLREGGVVAEGSVTTVVTALSEQREVNEQFFDARRFSHPEKIDAAAMEAEYKAQRAQFETPAQVRVEYLLLSLDTFKAQVKVDDAAVRKLYDSNLTRFSEPEQRRARHILIASRADQPAAERSKAKQKIEQILAEVKKTPAQFADLARKHSQDPGSAPSGGDLGYFTRDRMVKVFADTAFALKKGGLSGVVESEFGYHIVMLDDIRTAQAQPFERLKPQLTEEWRTQEAQRRFAEQADKFANQVYEQADGLAAVAKAYNLTVQTSGWISRAQAEPSFLAHAGLMDAIFSPESLAKKTNTDAIEVAPNTLVAARVLEHKPTGVRPLAEVAASLREQLAARAALAEARKAGTAALADSNTNMAWSAPMTLTRMRPLSLPPEAVKAIFKQSPKRLPVLLGVNTADGYRLYRLNGVRAGDEAAQHAERIREELRRMQAQSEVRAFVAAAKADLGVSIDAKVLGQTEAR